MGIIIAIVVIIVLFKFVIPFISYNKRNNSQAFNMLNDETRKLILNEDVLELAWLVTECEKSGDYRTGNIIMDACSHRGFSFANRVDRVRNELRIKAGLGPLKK